MPRTPEAKSHPRRTNERPYLLNSLDFPEKAQQIVHPIGAQVLLRHRAEFLFHLGIGHRILEVSAVVFNAIWSQALRN